MTDPVCRPQSCHWTVCVLTARVPDTMRSRGNLASFPADPPSTPFWQLPNLLTYVSAVNTLPGVKTERSHSWTEQRLPGLMYPPPQHQLVGYLVADHAHSSKCNPDQSRTTWVSHIYLLVKRWSSQFTDFVVFEHTCSHRCKSKFIVDRKSTPIMHL